MKNKLYTLIIFLAVLCIPEFAFAQARSNTQARPNPNARTNNNTNAAKPQTKTAAKRNEIPNYTLAQNKSFAHWSIGGGIGVNIFDGDINQGYKKLIPETSADWTLTGNIERTFNPIFGLGVGYAYIPYGAKPESYEMKGTTHEADFYLSVNTLNLFYRSRPQRWGLFTNIGMGVAFYRATTTNIVAEKIKNDQFGNPMDLDDGRAVFWSLSANLEYNISKYFACGLKVDYRLHNKDNFEGHRANVRQGNFNDAFEVLTFTLRYKPHFGKEYHVRNLSYGEMSLREINKRLADMENVLKGMAKGDSCCVSNTGRIEKIEKQLTQVDTVYVYVSREIQKAIANIPAPSVAPNAGEKGVVDDKTRKIFNQALRGIQFETAKADIKPVSYPILEQVIVVMKENPRFELDIIGHTDNVGDAKSNLDLSDRRAHAVRTYLMNKGIEGARLTSLGKGLTEPIATNSTVEGRALNRRVEFVVKQDGQILFKSE